MTQFLAVDAGTTSLKAALFDAAGQLLALDRQEYMLLTPAPGRVELEPETYWTALCCAVKNVMASAHAAPAEVATLCIASQGETLIPLDRQGSPACPAIVWLDNRAVDQAARITAHFGTQEAFSHTGMPEVSPTWPACKILWLRENQPRVFDDVEKFLLLEDYLLYRLTGQFAASLSLHTSSLILDINQRAWWPEMLDFLRLSPAYFGRLLAPGSPVGALRPEVSRALGLSPSTLAVCGGMDQVLGGIGAGNVCEGVVSEMTGGALAIVATSRTPVYDPVSRLPCYLHAIPGAYCLLPYGQTGGLALKWFRDEFFTLESAAAQAGGRDPYDLMTAQAAAVLPGCDGLVMLPHLEGAFCPEYNPAARAVFFGATLRHTRAHFTRAILEAVAFMLKRNLDLLESTGVPVAEVRSLGGGARSPLWLQIKADVLQKPVRTIHTEEASCLGAAILGAVASGTYPDLPSAVDGMITLHHIYDPHPELSGLYTARYHQYVELYDRLIPMFREGES